MREEGVGHVSLRAVARRVEVSHAAPAHHFANKAGLLTAFATQGFERLAAAVLDEIAAADDATNPAARLEAVGRGYVRFALTHPEQFEAMFRLELLDREDAGLVAAAARAEGLLLTTVEQCREAGLVPDEEVWPTALAAWSLVHGLSLLLASGWLTSQLGGEDPMSVTAGLSRRFVAQMVGARHVTPTEL